MEDSQENLDPCGFVQCRRIRAAAIEFILACKSNATVCSEINCATTSSTQRRCSFVVREIRNFSMIAVVIEVRCMSIRMCISDRYSLIAGGQYGEEGEEGEEGQKGEGLEVVPLPQRRDRQRCREQRRKGRRGLRPVSAMLLQVATPAWSTTEGVGETEVHPSRVLVFGPTANAGRGLVSLTNCCKAERRLRGRTKHQTNSGFSPTPSVFLEMVRPRAVRAGFSFLRQLA